MTPGTPEGHGTPEDHHGASPEDAADEAALERLRGADPARDAQVDMAALRAAVDRRIADASAAGDGDAEAGSVDPPGAKKHPQEDDGAAARAGRTGTRRGWVVAAAVATMLAVGTGGYIAGSQTGPTFDSAADHSAPESVQMTDESAAHPPPERSEDTMPESAAPTDSAQDGASDQDLPAVPGPIADDDPRVLPVEFVDAGLPTEARQADAWLVDTTGPHGEQADPVLLGEYPVISAAQAVDRLADPRFNGEVWSRLQAVTEAGPDREPAALEPGAPLTWPVEQIRLVSAALTVGGYEQPDGTMLMVPMWDIVDDQGRSWPVIAVAEDAMDFTAP
ncbi:MAG TPA: hypothetical protein VK063_06780 [Beutenbergiaceae bacterium]|nr:hypothetical protein [Beutenbergiaceae bacterium]